MRKPDSDCPEVGGPQCGLDLRRPRRGRRPHTSRSGTWALRLPLAALWMLRAACGRAFRANRRHPNDQHEPLAGPPQPRFRTPPRLGSLYAALNKGRIGAGVLRNLLARLRLADDRGRARVYAVDQSSWPRCDAECSQDRGYYYHPSRDSAGQPIVAGWNLPQGELRRTPPISSTVSTEHVGVRFGVKSLR